MEDRELLGKLSACKPHGADFLEHAALGIVVCGDSRESDTWIEDCSIASILIQMTAQSLGLGSCWIQVRSRRFNDETTSEQHVQDLLGIPGHVKVQSIIAVGYPAEKPDSTARRSIEDLVHPGRTDCEGASPSRRADASASAPRASKPGASRSASPPAPWVKIRTAPAPPPRW